MIWPRITGSGFPLILLNNNYLILAENNWRTPSSSATIHNLPYGLKSFAKPDMSSQNRRKTLRRVFDSWIYLRNFLRRFCEAMPGFAKLLSPKGELLIVALLVGALQLTRFPRFTYGRNFLRRFCEAMSSFAKLYEAIWDLCEVRHGYAKRRKKLRRPMQYEGNFKFKWGLVKLKNKFGGQICLGEWANFPSSIFLCCIIL